ncbi:hypothetical protein BDW74DRAFT_187612 [Aspergillus multicolor]|uniref:uncharacterized protein n=1 Tax=Aspergillus multicolor TaxID=41759 RepID=UPI003CCDE59A
MTDSGDYPPVPSVPIFTATTPVTEIIPALIRAGGCIIRNIIIPEVLAQVEEDTRKYIFSDTEWSGSFFPKETRRVCGLAGKSRTFITHIVSNTLFQSISDHFLTSRITCWIGDKREEHISRPQLNNTVVFSINPGASAQPLHRDDMIHHNKPVSRNPEEYKIGQDTGIGFFIAAKKSTKANGATRFIPGSHLWDLDTPPAEELAVYAEMVPGDAFVFFSSCYHGGSANTTLDEERLLYSFFMTKGYLRQEENQYLAARWEDVGSKYDDATLERLGYGVSAPFLGWVDLRHPLEALRGGTELRDLY